MFHSIEWWNLCCVLYMGILYSYVQRPVLLHERPVFVCTISSIDLRLLSPLSG